MSQPLCSDVMRAVRGLTPRKEFLLDTSTLPARGRPTSRRENHVQGIARLSTTHAGGWLAYSTSRSLTLARFSALGGRTGAWSRADARERVGQAVVSLPPPAGHDHVGGMQAVGHTLAVGSDGPGKAAISFYAVEAGAPTLHSRLDVTPWLPNAHYVGLVFLPDGRALCCAARDQRRGRVHEAVFFESHAPGLPLQSSGWRMRGRWKRAESSRSFQSASLIWDAGRGAPCFVGIGAVNRLRTRGRLSVFVLDVTQSEQVHGLAVGSRELRMRRREANFDAGASLYVGPGGDLLGYAAAKLSTRLRAGRRGLRFVELTT